MLIHLIVVWEAIVCNALIIVDWNFGHKGSHRKAKTDNLRELDIVLTVATNFVNGVWVAPKSEYFIFRCQWGKT